MSNISGADSSLTILCAICNKDLAALSATLRNSHVERCLDSNIGTLQNGTADELDASLATLDRLEDCPVCGSMWPSQDLSRAAHARACAKQFSVSNRDLVDLINLFRESLDEMSVSAAIRCGQSSRMQSKAVGSDASSGSSFFRAFSPQIKKSPMSCAKTTKPKGKGAATKLAGNRPLKLPIAARTNRRFSVESESNTDDDFDTRPKSSQASTARTNSPIPFDIPEDADFQSTRVRVAALKQTRIAVSRVDKRRQEFLDELDGDLNEAKALSLSLKRGPDLDLAKPAGKRRDTVAKSAAALMAKSDILASEDAQHFIRHRAVALEKMDEEHQIRIFDSLAYSAYSDGDSAAESQQRQRQQSAGGVRLWDLGSHECGPDGFNYCPIFENYKMGHSGHSSTVECLDQAVGHLIRSFALHSSEHRPGAAIGETLLRSGYTELIRVARQSFARQCAALRCAGWVEGAEPLAESNVDADGDVVVLSSSGSESDHKSTDMVFDAGIQPNDLAELPVSIGPCRDTDSKSIISQPVDKRKENLEPAPAPLLSRPNSKGIRQTVSAPKPPNYAKMPLLDLKKIASEFGLRVNTPRRLIEHQLKAIWEQTCGGGSSN
ncbi:5'-flap endonuclease, partial [Kickxella alabastrina]